MKICFLGMDNLPVLAEGFNTYGIGGEQVQQTLLARSLVKLGYQVSMAVYDYGQTERHQWDGIETYRTYRPTAGIPILRFIYPRWIKTWRALRKADADVYYVSCAGMLLGLAGIFCRVYGRKLIFRVAHDNDCKPGALLIKYWRDKKLYEFGLRRANLVLTQSRQQQADMLGNYGINSVIARMLVQTPMAETKRDIDVLWVNNLRDFKRPELFIEIAKKMPRLKFCMIGGSQNDFLALYERTKKGASEAGNVQFLGRLPYRQVSQYYGRARVFVNTSESEGFPNSYLQAWVHGTPTVVFFDPDSIIGREHLGYKVASIDEMIEKISKIVSDSVLHEEYSNRCKRYMASNYTDNLILETYLFGIGEICHA